MNIGERLTEKWGALPIWAWGAIVAGVGLIAYFMFYRNNDGAPVTGSSIDPQGYQTSGIQGGTAIPPTVIEDSNASWLNRVSRMVSTALSQSPTSVYAALQKWLSGQDITEQEKTWVDKAIDLGMAPPEGTMGSSAVIPATPAPSPAPTPTPAPKPAPTIVRYISATNGKWGEVAQLMSDNTIRPVTAAAYKRLGSPKITGVGYAQYRSYKRGVTIR